MASHDPDPHCCYQLSRYLQLRPEGEGFVAESLLTGRRRVLSTPASLRLFLSFSSRIRLSDLLSRASPAVAQALPVFLQGCLEDGLVTAIGEDGHAQQDELTGVRAWEPHDMAFHLRSRPGRHPYPSGATWHLADRLPPAPPHHAARTDAIGSIALPRPDLQHLQEQDWTLTRALEQRRTRYSLAAVPLQSLGELLFRTCRVTGSRTINGEELLRKVYPSGGSRHSIEVYVIAHRCAGLDPGAYRYDAREHRVEWLRRADEPLEAMLREAQRSTGVLTDLPSVLLVFSSRIARVTRKYQSNAYRVILKELGGIYQTIYLVAETLGLAASALGGGNSERFAQVLATDFFAEPSIGEMILAGPGSAGGAS